MKIGIITIIDNNNYGNRLQNYALSTYLKNHFNIDNITLKNNYLKNNRNNYYKNKNKCEFIKIKRNLKKFLLPIIDWKYLSSYARESNFKKFNKKINLSNKEINILSNLNNYDYVIVGSDQVWNPDHNRLSELDLLSNVEPQKRISYAASFGIDSLDKNNSIKVKKEISKFKAISVREDKGKEIIQNITNRQDVEVLIDPTMLLSSNEWEKVLAKPNNFKVKKYILNYFLGELSEERKKEINRIAKENNCEIINILDKNDIYYTYGPSEFLYLEKNAFLICTDSFHSCVFAIIFNKPFIIFDREQEGVKSMNSRLDTLIDKFELKNRKYNGKMITNNNLNHDYTEAYKILEKEREKSKKFLEKALDIEDYK